MDVNKFFLRVKGKALIMLDSDNFIFRRKHGRWALWNAKTGDEYIFSSAKELLDYTTTDGRKIGDVLEDMGDFTIPLNGGRGAGAGGGQVFTFGHSGKGKGGFFRSDLPARVNTQVKIKTRENAIRTFMDIAAKRPDREHAVTLTRDGFANSYTHGGRHEVALGRSAKGDLAVHNHPGGGSFSDTDLFTATQNRNLSGIVATYDKGMFGGRGYRSFTKGTHFKAEAFVKAVSTAKMRGKDYDSAVDHWLSRNQKTYGYKFKNVRLK